MGREKNNNIRKKNAVLSIMVWVPNTENKLLKDERGMWELYRFLLYFSNKEKQTGRRMDKRRQLLSIFASSESLLLYAI